MTEHPVPPSDDSAPEPLETVIDRVLALRTWAIVGCSPDPGRDSNHVAYALRDRGHRIVPVRPGADLLIGERCFGDLAGVPPDIHIDAVEIFRRSDQAGAHVDEAIARGVQAVWLPLDVVDEAAADRARAAGLDVVMDRCPLIELRRRDDPPLA